MAGSRLPLWGTVAGAVVGSVAAVGLVLGGVLQVPVRRDLRDAGGDLLTAWERSRRGTFVVETDLRRTLSDGRTLYSRGELVQRPPDRLVRQFGGVSGVVGGHPVVCSTDQGGNYQCFPGTEAAAPFEERLRSELDTFRTYLTPPAPGALPLYRAVRGVEAGCFELWQQLPYPDAPYGRFARLCFDEATGALRRLERHLDNGTVEVEEARSIDPTVRDGDFDTSRDDAYDLRMDLAPEPPATVPPSPPPGSSSSPPSPPASVPGSTVPAPGG